MNEASPPQRRRLRLNLSVRLMMLLVLGIGLWMGSWVNRAREQRAAVQAIRAMGGEVRYDWQLGKGARKGSRRPPTPACMKGLLSDDFFQIVELVFLVAAGRNRQGWINPDTRFSVECARFTHLKRLIIKDIRITDDDLRTLQGLMELEELYVTDASGVTDRGIAYLRGMKNLKGVTLSASQVTDDGLTTLTKLPGLSQIKLIHGRLTDAGLDDQDRFNRSHSPRARKAATPAVSALR